MKGMARAADAMGANLLMMSRAVSAAAAAGNTNLQRFVQEAAKMERRRTEFEIAVAAARNLVDAEGYVRLEALADVAFRYPDPRSFLDAVGTCVVSTQPCQCWWCQMKRLFHRFAGKAAVALRGDRD